jgi:hypothetical protein
MTDREQIWQCAKRDLVLAISPGRQDVFLWEHSRRVAENALRIAALPAASSGRSLDLVALEAAALYHDAGWACQYRDGAVQRSGGHRLVTCSAFLSMSLPPAPRA